MDESPHRYRPLNTSQLHVLNSLYRFRFATSNLLSQTTTKTTQIVMNRRLSLLMRQGYIGRNFEPAYFASRRPASYFLAPDGVQALRATADPRPITAYVMQFNVVTHYSFPSGHSASSLLAYGLLGYIGAHYLSPTAGSILAAAIGALMILIGASRVYLGAHFPSDVIGGWVFGGVILLPTVQLFLP